MSAFDESSYVSQNSNQAWSVTPFGDDSFRFEVRDGDYAAVDNGSYTAVERSDVVYSQTLDAAAPIHINFNFTVEEGAANTASFLVLAQMIAKMADGTSMPSPLDIDLSGEFLTVYARSKGEDGKLVARQIYSAVTPIERGHQYNLDIKTIFDPQGQGRLVLTLDGQVIADYNGALGYVGQAGVNWSEGISRGFNATETIAATFSDLNVESGEGVEFPPVTPFLQAPSLLIENVNYGAESTDYFVARMYGYAAGNSTVSLYLDGKFVGKTVAASNGSYSIDVRVDSLGDHVLKAVSSNGAGSPGIVSYPATFTIGEADNPLIRSPANFILAMDGEAYWAQNAGKSWSLTEVDDHTLRFEVRDRDVFIWDLNNKLTSERSEVWHQDVFADGVPVEVTYGMMIEPGVKNDAHFLIVGQLHQDNYPGAKPWGPPFAVDFVGEKMKLSIAYSGPDGLPVSKVLYVDTKDIQRGHFYNFDIKATFDASGEHGRLVVVRDGVTLVDYSGPLGYEQQNGVYWKHGIYRHANATDPIAVQFRDVVIQSGDKVKFPDAANFIPAPEIGQATVNLNDDDTATVVLTGSAKLGTTVVFFDGDKQIGTATVDSGGHFKTTLTLSPGGKGPLTAVAVSKTGQVGLGSTPMVIVVDTAANVAKQLPTLGVTAGLVAIVLTDTDIIPVSSTVELNTILNKGAPALSTIQGKYSFLLTTTPTGQSYTKQTESYSSKGLLLERLRYSGDKIVYSESYANDRSRVVKNYASDGSYTATKYNSSGVVTESDKYTSKGVLYFQEMRYADGSRVVHNFNQSSGLETGYIVYNADGTRVQVTTNIVGQSYVTQSMTYSATGKLVFQERVNAAGNILFQQKWYADGSTEVRNFDPTSGLLIKQTLTSADGTYWIKSYGVSGKDYAAEKISYTADKKIIAIERFDKDGALLTSEVYRADGSKQVFKIVDGNKVGYTLLAVDGSQAVVTYIKGGDAIAKIEKYDTAGKLSEIERYDTSGKVVSVETFDTSGNRSFLKTYDADGSSTLTAYSTVGQILYTLKELPSGVEIVTTYISGVVSLVETYDSTATKIESVSFAADGTKVVSTFSAGKLSSVASYDATNFKLSDTKFLNDGSSVVVIFSRDGSLQRDTFDSAGSRTSSTVFASDGSKTVSIYADGGIVTTESFNGSGVLTASKMWNSDGSVVVFSVDKNGLKVSSVTKMVDGTSVVSTFAPGHQELRLSEKVFDTAGRLYKASDFDSLGRLLKTEVYAADGSRESHFFDATSGKELSFRIREVDGARIEGTLGIVGKGYTSQIAHYDKFGKLIEMDRYVADGKVLVFKQQNLQDGSSEVSNYDAAGRLSSLTKFNVDGSKDVVTYSYDGSNFGLQSSTMSHYGSGNVLQSTDVTGIDGTHSQRSYADGVTLTSHEAVTDVLFGFSKGSDRFVFGTHMGHDEVSGFQTGRSGGPTDKIVIDQSLAQNFDGLKLIMSSSGGDTVITFSHGDSIRLKDVAPESLDQGHFVFADNSWLV